MLKNEALFGPLQLKTELCYEISNVKEISNELLNYIKLIDDETNLKTNIIDLIESAYFLRIIKLDLRHIKPIIGLITVNRSYSPSCISYNISHISVHESFRDQGLAKLMVFSFINFMSDKYTPFSFISCIVPSKLDKCISLFRSLKFNEIVGNNYHMLKSIKQSIKMIEEDIIAL